jgi:predicted MPP superfamily phosphohydrolase
MNAIRAILVALPIAVVAQGNGWQANPDVVRRASQQQAGFNYDEARVGPYTLPDPLAPVVRLKADATTAGARVRTPEDWRERRTEIRDLFRANVYGRVPTVATRSRLDVIAENAAAMSGAATLKRIAIVTINGSREHRFELTLFLPNSRRPAPVFLLLNNRPATNTDPTRKEKSGFWPAEDLIARGYGIAALQVGDIAPDDKDKFRYGVMSVLDGAGRPRAPDGWGALAAWAWAASRAMDYFQTDARVDAKHVAVVGHSRGGKAALWAGAEDERFALVISNESGEGGAALTRRNFGETLARITTSFPHWFAERYKSFAGREAELPVDQHMLIALIAPRAVYVASADEDLWSDPRGEFLALAESSPVFALWGDRAIRPDDMPPLEQPLVSGRRGYHIRRGPHNLTPYDWARFADFADKLWQGSSAFFFLQFSDPQFGMFTDNKDFAQETSNFEFAIATANRLRPAFLIVTGDLVNKPGDPAQIAEYRRVADKLDRSIPLYNVAGNHDVENVPTPESVAAYVKVFGPDRYSFRHGSLYGIVLDSSIIHSPDKTPDIAAAQESWVRTELEKARQSGAKHIVIFQHHPWFLRDAAEDDQYFNIPKARRAAFLELFRQAGVKYLFSGHYHRNAVAHDGDIEAITTGPVGKPLGEAKSGLRVVIVTDNGISHRYYDFGELPAQVSLNSPEGPPRDRDATPGARGSNRRGRPQPQESRPTMRAWSDLAHRRRRAASQ